MRIIISESVSFELSSELLRRAFAAQESYYSRTNYLPYFEKMFRYYDKVKRVNNEETITLEALAEIKKTIEQANEDYWVNDTEKMQPRYNVGDVARIDALVQAIPVLVAALQAPVTKQREGAQITWGKFDAEFAEIEKEREARQRASKATASSASSFSLFELKEPSKTPEEELYVLCGAENKARITTLLANPKLEINKRFQWCKETCLMRAASEGHLWLVQLLLEHGADKTLQDFCDNIAAKLAENAKHVSIRDLINQWESPNLSHKADCNNPESQYNGAHKRIDLLCQSNGFGRDTRPALPPSKPFLIKMPYHGV